MHIDLQITGYFGHQLLLVHKDLHLKYTITLKFTVYNLDIHDHMYINLHI